MVLLLVTAGYETTYTLITMGVATLLDHPDQLDRLGRDPELISSAVEEILRFTGTLGATKPNYAAEDIDWHGTLIPRGAMVFPLLASANRDADIFAEPDVFDITRTPNDHVTFGYSDTPAYDFSMEALAGEVTAIRVMPISAWRATANFAQNGLKWCASERPDGATFLMSRLVRDTETSSRARAAR